MLRGAAQTSEQQRGPQSWWSGLTGFLNVCGGEAKAQSGATANTRYTNADPRVSTDVKSLKRLTYINLQTPFSQLFTKNEENTFQYIGCQHITCTYK